MEVKTGIKVKGKFSATTPIDVFDDEALNSYKEAVIEGQLYEAVTAFIATTNVMPTSIALTYGDKNAIRDVYNKRLSSYMSIDDVYIEYDGIRIKIIDGCNLKAHEYILYAWYE